jgi:hypothetical protein
VVFGAQSKRAHDGSYVGVSRWHCHFQFHGSMVILSAADRAVFVSKPGFVLHSFHLLSLMCCFVLFFRQCDGRDSGFCLGIRIHQISHAYVSVRFVSAKDRDVSQCVDGNRLFYFQECWLKTKKNTGFLCCSSVVIG